MKVAQQLDEGDVSRFVANYLLTSRVQVRTPMGAIIGQNNGIHNSFSICKQVLIKQE